MSSNQQQQQQQQQRVVVQLKESIDDYAIAIRLSQHLRVSKLCIDIARALIEFYDQSVQECQSNELNKQERDIVERICDLLRKRSELSAIYWELTEFVRVHDMVCLGKLSGSIETTVDVTPLERDKRLVATYENLVKTLRQSIILLREIFSSTKSRSVSEQLVRSSSLSCSASSGACWLKKSDISQVPSGVSFPKYLIRLKEEEVKEENLISQWKAVCAEESSQNNVLHLADVLLSNSWFVNFVERELLQVYPVDKFTVLVAVWIIGVESKHLSLQEIVGELVDQIFHQETNSCNLEDFSQLTQLGSFWLSYHKRFLVTTCGAGAGQQAEEEARNCFEEDEQTSSSGSNADDDDDNFLEEATRVGRAPLGGRQKERSSNRGRPSLSELAFLKRVKLRRIINEELLIGTGCLLCGREPSAGDLLEPLQEIRCEQCGAAATNQQAAYCSLSFARVRWLCLRELLKVIRQDSSGAQEEQQLELLVLTPADWIRQVLVARRGRQGEPGDEEEEEGGTCERRAPVERMEITEKFERLTMRPDGSGGSSAASSDGDGEIEDGEPLEELGEYCSQLAAENDESMQTLLNFMRRRASLQSLAAPTTSAQRQRQRRRRHSSNWPSSANGGGNNQTGFMRTGAARVEGKLQLSESLLMARFASQVGGGATGRLGGGGGIKRLVICSSDLLVLDSLNDSIKVRLMCFGLSAARDCNGAGQQEDDGGDDSGDESPQLVLACRSRSPAAKLLLGCGRLYKPLEFCRATGGLVGDGAPLTCPKCECRLLELRRGLFDGGSLFGAAGDVGAD